MSIMVSEAGVLLFTGQKENSKDKKAGEPARLLSEGLGTQNSDVLLQVCLFAQPVITNLNNLFFVYQFSGDM